MFRTWDLTTPPPTTEDTEEHLYGPDSGRAAGPCHRHYDDDGDSEGEHREHSGRPCPFDEGDEWEHFEENEEPGRRKLEGKRKLQPSRSPIGHPAWFPRGFDEPPTWFTRDGFDFDGPAKGAISAEPYEDVNGETWVWRDPTRTDVYIGSSVNYIGNEAFAWLMAEGGDVHFPADSSLLLIGHDAFRLTVVSSGYHLPDSVEWIGETAFHLVHGGSMKLISTHD